MQTLPRMSSTRAPCSSPPSRPPPGGTTDYYYSCGWCGGCRGPGRRGSSCCMSKMHGKINPKPAGYSSYRHHHIAPSYRLLHALPRNLEMI
uniref:Uncharacterized protein n=1 Tax=Arundo donax TaxID=35708 RepID=A0A0A9AH31_ARUDO